MPMLTMDVAGGLGLLEKAGLVDDQHGVRIGQSLDHVLAHDIAQGVSARRAPPF